MIFTKNDDCYLANENDDLKFYDDKICDDCGHPGRVHDENGECNINAFLLGKMCDCAGFHWHDWVECWSEFWWNVAWTIDVKKWRP